MNYDAPSIGLPIEHVVRVILQPTYYQKSFHSMDYLACRCIIVVISLMDGLISLLILQSADLVERLFVITLTLQLI